MSKPFTHYRSWEEERKHREIVARKYEKIEGLKALLAMWEEHPDTEHAYILELRAKLRSAENQLQAMKP